MSDILDMVQADEDGGRPSASRSWGSREILAQHPMFAPLTSEELDRLASAVHVKRYERGRRVFSKGDPGSGLMAVLSGSSRISSTSKSGAEIVFNVSQSGEVFGEISLLDGRPRTADAVAVTDSEVLTLDRRDFIPVLSGNPEVALHLLTVMCDRMRRASQQVEDALVLDTPARLANAILRLAQPNGGLELRLRATQKQLGETIGLSRESTNKQLQIWVRKNWIEIEKGGVVVRDASALSACASSGRS